MARTLRWLRNQRTISLDPPRVAEDARIVSSLVKAKCRAKPSWHLVTGQTLVAELVPMHFVPMPNEFVKGSPERLALRTRAGGQMAVPTTKRSGKAQSADVEAAARHRGWAHRYFPGTY